MKLRILILLAIPFLFSACASIMDNGPKNVQINTNPEGAKVTVFNRAGQQIITQTTPAILSLKRSSGFAREEKYKLVFVKEGYYPRETQVKSVINGWYFGNILFGGVIGCVIDMGTGSCYTLSPTTVSYNLVSSDIALSPEELIVAELKANPTAVKPKELKQKSRK